MGRGCFVLSSMKETCHRAELAGGEAWDLVPASYTHATIRFSPGLACLGLRLPFPQGAWKVDISVIVVFPSPASV